MLWTLAPRPAVLLRTWDDDASGIAYDERNGDTFVLGPLALELIAMLREGGARGSVALLDELAHDLGPDTPATLAADIEAELARLSERGLVLSLPST
ncbi:MAG: HPr-rel-A system PqqD family peptide chaperone [Rubrivivax sp.]